MISRMTHGALHAACFRSARRFQDQRFQLESVQRRKLDNLLKLVASARIQPAWQGSIPSWESFRQSYPVTRYADWQKAIRDQRNGKESLVNSAIVRYQPTSGSSEKLKLIPYTRAFLGELDAAIAPWLASMYRRNPGLKCGVHYWSVSWLPQNQYDDLRGNLNDDSELMGGVKRFLASHSQAVSPDVALAASPGDAMFASLCYLVARADLRMLSVWSPTFALQLLDMLPRFGDDIARVLSSGHWGDRAQSLLSLKAPRAPERARLLEHALQDSPQQAAAVLWKDLALVSAWDTADAAPWAGQLRERLPHSAFEGKGLWATEGVVTIPVDGHYPLAYQSHVYEFEDLRTGNILAPWELKEGDEVSPIISGGNGMLRYQLDDRMAVSEMWGEVPCFSFLGRRHGVDLVGEKMSPEAARQTLQAVADQYGLEPVTLLAVDGQGRGKSAYVAIFSQPGQTLEPIFPAHIGQAVERSLGSHFHYALARDLQQLQPATAVVVADGWQLYQQIAMAGGMIEGNIKPEPVRKVPRDAFCRILPEPGVRSAANMDLTGAA
ncbi:MAG: GH3 auxin-responsive promoter family protein [Fluviicoccus sp.]|uniref:GH3 family domain-containing protein n=1 Tax=Fluviicoccus sp. TaxID=2003552 RepID=UPI0027189648|nr:GH3 auxin-responsive promoter family protein [Fluviicoccus sp.]MDO8330031.1 GH3 auxin-responsive promoter family protein [Fluviicoccus sp.]